MSKNFLKPHKNGTARKDVYYKYFHNKKLTNITYQMRNCQNATACQRWKMVWHFHKNETDPVNTLLDYPDFLMLNTRESVANIPTYKFNRLIALDLDNEAVSFTGAAFWFHSDSEFLQIFNHYIMKVAANLQSIQVVCLTLFKYLHTDDRDRCSQEDI